VAKAAELASLTVRREAYAHNSAAVCNTSEAHTAGDDEDRAQNRVPTRHRMAWHGIASWARRRTLERLAQGVLIDVER
jgi:hypothetical protein